MMTANAEKMKADKAAKEKQENYQKKVAMMTANAERMKTEKAAKEKQENY